MFVFPKAKFDAPEGVLDYMSRRGCRVEMFGKAAFDEGYISRHQGNRFFDTLNQLTIQQQRPFSTTDWGGDYPSLN
ncbi:MAG TPA: hypothetical protein VN038_13345 [Dyadobacter sp.]|nr:hypothetical protein [Dyadobacter sp.]